MDVVTHPIAADPAWPRVHGGPDDLGPVAHDFSSNSNACGPCPDALHAVTTADASRYPDPSYRALREQLAAFHGVALARVVLAGSASEFIFRLSAALAQQAAAQQRRATVHWPPHSYGDYRHAAAAWGLAPVATAAPADLVWACEPSSPHGQACADLAATVQALRPAQTLVLDGAYRPLRLDGAPALTAHQLDHVWQLWSPNKALGLTGLRAAYAVAPQHQTALVPLLDALAPSWVLGAHGQALLLAWTRPEVQQWLAHSLDTLRQWKQRQLALCADLGWQCLPSVTSFYVAQTHHGTDHAALANGLTALRAQGIKLRDAQSFGLPGWVRVAVLAPAAQDALWQACASMNKPIQA